LISILTSAYCYNQPSLLSANINFTIKAWTSGVYIHYHIMILDK